jgi:hypothetical protein
MESKNGVILLIAIIAVLGLVIGVMFSQTTTAKKPTEIKITSNKTLFKGDDLSVKLTDLNKTSLSKEKVKIIIKDSKGKIVINKTVKTNSKGNAKLDLDLKKGKYDVTVNYNGNENYTGNNTTQKLTVKEEKVVETTPDTSQSEDTNSNNDEQEQIDYNSPDSNYYKWYTDGSYHEKQDGVKYVYAQDARTGEWSYWLDKS